MQGNTRTHKGKGAGRYSPPDVHAQAEEGALDHAKTSGEDFGVMSARAGSGTLLPQPDRCARCIAPVPLIDTLLPDTQSLKIKISHVDSEINVPGRQRLSLHAPGSCWEAL